MNKKRLNQLGLSLIACFLLAACCTDQPIVREDLSRDMIPNFFLNNVVLATGIDFKTGKSIVLNPISGEEIKPCQTKEINKPSGVDTARTIKHYQTPPETGDMKQIDNQKTCESQIVYPSQELINSINSSERILNGTIRKNGKDIPARFVISITALFEGSNCATFISLGKQYQYCSQTSGNCNLLSPLYAQSNNESYRRSIRTVCTSFPTWKTTDCGYLRPRYRTVAPFKTLYALPYKQYIWDNCRTVPNTGAWGNRPTATAP